MRVNPHYEGPSFVVGSNTRGALDLSTLPSIFPPIVIIFFSRLHPQFELSIHWDDQREFASIRTAGRRPSP